MGNLGRRANSFLGSTPTLKNETRGPRSHGWLTPEQFSNWQQAGEGKAWKAWSTAQNLESAYCAVLGGQPRC